MQTNPRFTLARRRACHVIHPAYAKAVQAKPAFPTEIYGYPACARRKAANDDRLLTIPVPQPAHQAAPSTRGLVAVYCTVALIIWFVAANVPMGV
ncbi:hypothetical protein [Paracandidimonas lactea]|uniref:hypothetical protein n=1 Tax=Paracandidimonas lactea TaxID=2895524 RepID=UPI001F4827AB|nr:hypothetical protein [Paracandidimonas lactea]